MHQPLRASGQLMDDNRMAEQQIRASSYHQQNIAMPTGNIKQFPFLKNDCTVYKDFLDLAQFSL
jgi:hypothetical protein